MVDYYSHIATLAILKNELATISPKAPGAALQTVSDAINGREPYAVLGTLIDHLLEHAGDSDSEIAILNEASAIWTKIADILAIVAQTRQYLEDLVMNPAQPNVLDKFNNVSATLKGLGPQINDLVAEMQGLFAEVNLLNYIPQHGQALDHAVKDWTWKDISLSRRTGAFIDVLGTLAKAEGSKEALALAYGATSGYAVNVLGSGYLNQTVGGPRRAHPIRSRLSAYATGAWLRINHPQLTMSLPFLRGLISFGPPHAPKLPDNVANLLNSALHKTYGNLKPLPDLGKAYKKLIHHLDLLSAFPDLPLPSPIANSLWIQCLAQHIPGVDGPLGTVAQADTHPQDAAAQSNWPAWKIALIVACALLLLALVAVAGAKSGGSTPSTSNFPGPTNNTGEAQGFLTSNDALVQVSVLFNAHMTMWQAAITGLKTLKLFGLLYPEAIDMAEPQFSQFTAVAAPLLTVFHRPIADPNNFLLLPDSASENPALNISPYPVGSDPTAFLFGAGTSPGIASYGQKLWADQAYSDNKSELKKLNRNLDGDRGFEHPCWKLSSGLITTDPLSIEILKYDEI